MFIPSLCALSTQLFVAKEKIISGIDKVGFDVALKSEEVIGSFKSKKNNKSDSTCNTEIIPNGVGNNMVESILKVVTPQDVEDAIKEEELHQMMNEKIENIEKSKKGKGKK